MRQQRFLLRQLKGEIMADQVQIHPKIEKQLTAMEKQANAPSIAAGRARKIIDALIQGQETESPGLLRSRSDKRVKDSRKFDLGSGFRLICIKTRRAIYVMHVGDHESCDAWFDQNSKKRPHKKTLSMDAFDIVGVHVQDRAGSRSCESIPAEFDMDDDPYLTPVPQEYLRKVFSGLVAG